MVSMRLCRLGLKLGGIHLIDELAKLNGNGMPECSVQPS
jgi:hypothetical protein